MPCSANIAARDAATDGPPIMLHMRRCAAGVKSYARWLVLAGWMLAGAGSVRAGVVWTNDFHAALVQARASDRPILAAFTGSDWCPFCFVLDREIFAGDAFQRYADANLVLFVADFPRDRQLPRALTRQNWLLHDAYSIEERFPTVLLLNPQGRILARTGYRPGGAEAYVALLQDLLKQAGWKTNTPTTTTTTMTNQAAAHADTAAGKK